MGASGICICPRGAKGYFACPIHGDGLGSVPGPSVAESDRVPEEQWTLRYERGEWQVQDAPNMRRGTIEARVTVIRKLPKSIEARVREDERKRCADELEGLTAKLDEAAAEEPQSLPTAVRAKAFLDAADHLLREGRGDG